MQDQSSLLALDVLVLDETVSLTKSISFKKRTKKRCCNKIYTKNKQCKRCPLISRV